MIRFLRPAVLVAALCLPLGSALAAEPPLTPAQE